jgi:uncharacterized protein YjbI with pentapeptide repeats
MMIGSLVFSGAALAADYQGQKFNGTNLEGQELTGQVCYHSSFTDVNLKSAQFKFSTVVRYCNFDRVNADGAYFDSFFYAQTFTDSSFVRARFRLNRRGLLPSEIKFVGSDLRGAIIMGDISRVSFVNSKLDGALVNDRLCDETLSCIESSLVTP